MDKAKVKEALGEAIELTKAFPEHMQGDLAAAVFLLAMGGPPRPEQSQSRIAPRRPVPSEETLPGTLGEFLAEFGNLPHPHRITAVAAFRFQSANVETLTADELRDAYSEVRAPKPQNLSANIAKCMSKGWLVQAPPKDGKKAWRITQKGLGQVSEWRTSE